MEVKKRTLAFVAAGLCAYYAFGWAVRQYPHDLRLVPLYSSLIFATALYSVYFFRQARSQFDRAKSVFLHENNGFLLGYVVAVLELLLQGQKNIQVLPTATALGYRFMWSRLGTGRAQER